MTNIGSGRMQPLPEEVRRLFHALWSKAVGTKSYVKAEWIELDRLLHEEINRERIEHRASEESPVRRVDHPYHLFRKRKPIVRA